MRFLSIIFSVTLGLAACGPTSAPEEIKKSQRGSGGNTDSSNKPTILPPITKTFADTSVVLSRIQGLRYVTDSCTKNLCNVVFENAPDRNDEFSTSQAVNFSMKLRLLNHLKKHLEKNPNLKTLTLFYRDIDDVHEAVSFRAKDGFLQFIKKQHLNDEAKNGQTYKNLNLESFKEVKDEAGDSHMQYSLATQGHAPFFELMVEPKIHDTLRFQDPDLFRSSPSATASLAIFDDKVIAIFYDEGRRLLFQRQD